MLLLESEELERSVRPIRLPNAEVRPTRSDTTKPGDNEDEPTPNACPFI
jgi:hypothetical protein